MRIFITGATGFIGQHIVSRLNNGEHQLLLMSRGLGGQLRKGGQVLQGDIGCLHELKAELIRFDPEACIHLAWEGIPDFSYTMCKRNLDNSLDLINTLVNETKCKKIIVSGSCYEYGQREGACSETDVPGINSNIAWAKNALYQYAQHICHKESVDLVWFRIFYVYGQGQREVSLIPSLIRSFCNGVVPEIKSPLNANDFVHIKDVAEAFRMATEKNIKSGIYNLGYGRSTQVIEICRLVEKIFLGKTDLCEHLKTDGVSDPVNSWADIKKAKNELGWEPKISIEEGIREFKTEKVFK